MFLNELRKIARPNWFKILMYLKCSTGMSVSELAREMKMSYMGVKQHCLDLEKRGFLDTWRRPKAIGRPEKIYRVTQKANVVFPNFSNDLTTGILEAVRQAYGGSAPEKMLYSYYQRKTEAYLELVEGQSFEQRAESFAQARSREGYLGSCEAQNGAGEYVEYHNPLQEIMTRYPSVVRMEETLVSKVLGGTVQRTQETVSGVVKTTYRNALQVERA